MKKEFKDIDKNIIKALTAVCEAAKSEGNGFQWLTHLVNYNRFPSSLKIVCVFSTKLDLIDAKQLMMDRYIIDLIKSEFEKINVRIKNIERHVTFDSQEACSEDHNGNWDERFRSLV